MKFACSTPERECRKLGGSRPSCVTSIPNGRGHGKLLKGPRYWLGRNRTDGRLSGHRCLECRYSEDRAFASNIAAAFADSNVSAVPRMTRSSSRPSSFLALRRTSHVGTLSSVKTNRVKPPKSVETAGLGQSGGSGCQSMLAIYSLLHRCQLWIDNYDQISRTWSNSPRPAAPAAAFHQSADHIPTAPNRGKSALPAQPAGRQGARTVGAPPYRRAETIQHKRSVLAKEPPKVLRLGCARTRHSKIEGRNVVGSRLDTRESKLTPC